MKITSLQISNVLSFPHHEDINDANKIEFDENLNILIGENGAGKSTVLEVINFLFKEVFNKQYSQNLDLFDSRETVNSDQKKQILHSPSQGKIRRFRLEPNWNTTEKSQAIRVKLKLDAIDKANIEKLVKHKAEIESTQEFAGYTPVFNPNYQEEYTIDIAPDWSSDTYSIQTIEPAGDFGIEYLTEYNYFKGAIDIYNLLNPEDPISSLNESFTLISSFRNYHAFSASISLGKQTPSKLRGDFMNRDYARGSNTPESGEPSVFSLVKMRVAEEYLNLIQGAKERSECEEEANNIDFMKSINERLELINLKCRIKLEEIRTWQFSFEFVDLKRDVVVSNINSLSAGQKAILHLVFEAYGRGEFKGGLVVIDEPEIHLHHQFQHEYLQVIEGLNQEQQCQYILVTHSEALINSSTIGFVKRLSLDADRNTQINSPTLNVDQRHLIKILDNTRSTYALFASKVLIVEGDTDRYFFKAVLKELYPRLVQEIAVVDTSGKGGLRSWKELFESFGLRVFSVNDFDFIQNEYYSEEPEISFKDHTKLTQFKTDHPDWSTNVDKSAAEGVFILREGDLEHYLGITHKGLPAVISFCDNDLNNFFQNAANDPIAAELLKILEVITS